MKKQKLTPELFNLKMFDVLLAFQLFKEFGNVDLGRDPKQLTSEHKEKVKELVKEITLFNNQLNKLNEKPVQFGQDDQREKELV